ncbi:MAG: dienelactone hydrolase domain-containing protein [Linnemannia elongata]|nr:MAG: dienelactone hydrolase domain-containing protein [Linnemannia elongata]
MAPIDVTFPSNNNIKLAGHLYVPASYKEGERLPAIVVLHPGGGVKEQTAGTYAAELAKHGFITLAFDRSTQGASEGTPRCVEDPYAAIEDTKSAVTYLSVNDKVDPNRIGVFGVCAGGGYAIAAASADARIKAVAGASTVDIGLLFAGSLPEEVLASLVAQAGENRTEYAKGGEIKYLPYIPPDVKDSPVLMKEAYDYYLTPRGSHSRSVNKFALWSYDTLVAFDAFARIERISPRPLLLIAGTDADTIEHSRIAIAKAGKPSELFTVAGATHVDLYDRKVNDCVPKLIEFFKQSL